MEAQKVCDNVCLCRCKRFLCSLVSATPQERALIDYSLTLRSFCLWSDKGSFENASFASAEFQMS